ncbi:conserved hypothetical protein [Methylobacterium sp. 4-46]|uniref:hypothetical protein n=1 Tax=unclassified Methylobacterium TaxID=2615210 RepID=UPI000152C672|nr:MULTISPECIES: hypothetical protein [Methylobacterium]ACA17008.1 conserved hypothetical protein [Methylobacterium sp. 4-46]WFT82697.1 hypothetical protein QA634_13030 [Methylobacterium nodulans]
MAGGTQAGGPRSTTGRGGQGGESLYDQATSAARNLADQASDRWDDVAEQGSRYVQRGRDYVGDVDGATMTGWFVAGAIGFGLAWLMFGQRSITGDYVARGMSRSSERYDGYR